MSLSFSFSVMLPDEMWSYIFRLAIGDHETMTYRALKLTSTHFHSIVADIKAPTHYPVVYLSPHHIHELCILPGRNIINKVAYRHILDVCGPFSGLGLVLPQLLQDVDPDGTVLHLRHRAFGKFSIIDVQHNPRHCKCRNR